MLYTVKSARKQHFLQCMIDPNNKKSTGHQVRSTGYLYIKVVMTRDYLCD